MRRDSFSILRETMRWRVALVLGIVLMLLMLALAALNTHLGYRQTAMLAWGILVVETICVAALLILPRRIGGTMFFIVIVAILVVSVVVGWFQGRYMHHWAYIMPPVLVFLMRARPALAGMLVFGAFVAAVTASLIPLIDLVRFVSGYGMLVCFVFTYALLQERAAAMLRFHSDHDALTNCLNRRTFNEALDQLAASGARGDCTFLLIDIDHFKAINDQHGHLVGDRVITQVAAELGRSLDPGVPLFRYGGEEFAVMLGAADAGAGARLAERMRERVAATDFQGVRVTVSIGVSIWRAGHGSISSAVGRADQALYEAKRGGRNRVVIEARSTNAMSTANA